MDVVKICIIFFPFIMLATSCNQKKTVESVSTSSVECRGEPLENRFIVQWEDGSFTVERGNNMEEFRSTFIKDNLAFIKHVDHDYNVRVAPLTLNSDGNTSSAATLNWGPISIQAPQLWAENILGDGVIVGVIDGMVDVNHAQLRPNILVNNNEIPDNGLDDDKNGVVDDYLGAKFTQQVNDPVENTHGSHVAGIIAADSSKGPIQGVAPKVKIIPAQFIGNKGEGAIGDAITAMNYAVSRGAKILNLSWGGAPCIQTLASAMENFSAKGILLITAAGNGDKYSNGINVDERPNYPSAFGLLNQINVAASTNTNFLIGFSNFGRKRVSRLSQIWAPPSCLLKRWA